MSAESKLAELERALSKIEKRPVSDAELIALNAFVADLLPVLQTGEQMLATLRDTLATQGVRFDECGPEVLDIRKCIAALATARGELREALEQALRARGVMQ